MKIDKNLDFLNYYLNKIIDNKETISILLSSNENYNKRKFSYVKDSKTIELKLKDNLNENLISITIIYLNNNIESIEVKIITIESVNSLNEESLTLSKSGNFNKEEEKLINKLIENFL